ncbi:hypothetical protein [Desulfobacterium sp. N47]|uniref:Uncharacterized protein n=1 Tax=uncultured Desulfobacterium sp. TaxID=201089 RepID=E1Y991_9BACT|nr:unknown protein [uncultured Desulfobacterium sp.]
MGYTFKIGNAVPKIYEENDYMFLRFEVEPVVSEDAPAFKGDEATGKTNIRRPSYINWHEFCKETGILDVFFDDRGNLRFGKYGCVMLRKSDHIKVKEALELWQKTATIPPGFDDSLTFNEETQQWYEEGEQKYDYQLARLIWLEWWMGWALKNCETPAIEYIV